MTPDDARPDRDEVGAPATILCGQREDQGSHPGGHDWSAPCVQPVGPRGHRGDHRTAQGDTWPNVGALPSRTRRTDPMAPVDALADHLLGPVRQQPDTLLGQIVLTGIRRATVLATVEVFGSSDQRVQAHRLLEQNRRQHG